MASLGNKGKYTTLTRVSQYLNQVEAVATLIAYYNWTRVAIIRNMGSVCDSCLAAINEALDFQDINLAATLVANFSNPNDVGYTLKELKTWARSAFGHVMINSKADRSTRFVAQRILQSGNLETFLFLSRPFADDDIR
uniref:Receptor ligand binding region domain-containing protein n=1 Tax=Romanomermis culicivorax TaxID=13658 RepID=A0A915IRL6_ROMCU